MIFRLSQKLAEKIKAGKLDEVPQDDNPLIDWSAHIFSVGRTPYILLSNTQTMFSCVMFAKGNSNDSHFIKNALTTIREFLEDGGYGYVYQEAIIPSTGAVTFAKSLNRSVTGSMKKLIQTAEWNLIDGDLAPHEIVSDLNGILLSMLAPTKADGYGKPDETFRELVESAVWEEGGEL